MPVGSRPRSSAPAFFLDSAPGESLRLQPEDALHAARVLRLGAGDLLFGLDGKGGRFPLRVREVQRNELQLEAAGEREHTPAPGEEGSPLPWFEVAVSWPRRNRVEEMVSRLVQLGVAAIRPLLARQRGPEEVPEEVTERVRRVAREACKQSGRAWLPEFEARLAPDELAKRRPDSALALLDPEAGLALDTWLRCLQPAPGGLGTRTRPIVLLIGPEGGIAAEEREALLLGGASPTWLAPHILRVETAAEAAMAVAAVVHGRTTPR